MWSITDQKNSGLFNFHYATVLQHSYDRYLKIFGTKWRIAEQKRLVQIPLRYSTTILQN